MDILHLVIFAAGFQSILFGLYLLAFGSKGKRQNIFLAIFLLQLGIDLMYSFFELEKLYYNNRVVFYLPLYVTTLPTVALIFYFTHILSPGIVKKRRVYLLWLIPAAEFVSLVILLVQFLRTGTDLWLTNELHFTKIFNLYIIQLVNILLGVGAVVYIYALLSNTSKYLKLNKNWSVEVIKSLRLLKIFLGGFLIFHVAWSVMTGFDLFLNASPNVYDRLLPYVYLMAALLTQWISFRALIVPKVAISPWVASHKSKFHGGFFTAMKEKDIPLVIVDHRASILFANQKIRDLLGYSFKELEGKAISAVVSSDDLDSIDNVFLLEQREAATFKSEFVFKMKKGGKVWAEIEAVTGKNWHNTTSAIFYLTDYKVSFERDTHTSETQRIIKQKIHELLYDEKVYLDPNLSIRSLASHLEISDRYASMMIKQFFNKNFREVVNELRVSAVKEMMNDTSYSNYSILSIGLEAGFNSKSTFHSVFRKYTGMSPAEHQKMQSDTSSPKNPVNAKTNG
ncbi:MAG: helix-turn-helix domain-containing protein [Bacteroidota bacterium]